MRRSWSKYPERQAAIRDSRRPYKGDSKKIKWEHQCNICKQWYVWRAKKAAIKAGSVGMSVDHIIPCGTFLCEADFLTFIPRLFCDKSGLQVLCDVCHNKKSYEDRWGACEL